MVRVWRVVTPTPGIRQAIPCMPVDTDWHFFTWDLPARRQTALLYAGRLSPRRGRASPTGLYYDETEHTMLHLSTSPGSPIGHLVAPRAGHTRQGGKP